MKTKEILNVLKEEAENMNNKLAELSENELAQVSGGLDIHTITKNDIDCGGCQLSDCSGLLPAPGLPAKTLQPGAYKPDDLPDGFR